MTPPTQNLAEPYLAIRKISLLDCACVVLRALASFQTYIWDDFMQNMNKFFAFEIIN